MPQPPMLATHLPVFSAAARLYNVHILVRRTNLMSLQYIGKPGFSPKRLDCKAKTADLDYTHPQFGPMRTAGLVVDPHVTGQQVYKSAGKYAEALKEWGKIGAHLVVELATPEAQRRPLYFTKGRNYFVELNPQSGRYGCVKFHTYLSTAATYVHGDFDLYGIVRADDPARNVAVGEFMLATPDEVKAGNANHFRSPELLDVQTFVNSRIGAPMILHGAQEGYKDHHSDEAIDIFHPDGTITAAENGQQIAELYATVFQGRKLFTKSGARQVVRGGFKTPG